MQIDSMAALVVVCEAASKRSLPLDEVSQTKRGRGRPRKPCEAPVCLEQRALVQTLTARIAELGEGRRLLTNSPPAALVRVRARESCGLCAEKESRLQSLEAAVHTETNARRSALRALASVRGELSRVREDNANLQKQLLVKDDVMKSLAAELAAAAHTENAQLYEQRYLDREARKLECAENAKFEALEVRHDQLRTDYDDALEELSTSKANLEQKRQIAREAADELRKVRKSFDAISAELSAERADAKYKLQLEERRAKRRPASAEKVPPVPRERTCEEWQTLSYHAESMARSREIKYISWLLEQRTFRPEDLCTALYRSGYLDDLWECREVQRIYLDELRCVMAKLTRDHFGIQFGLHLHFEAHLPVKTIVELSQAASKSYGPIKDFYGPKRLLVDPFLESNFVEVPRLAPPASQVIEAIREIESRLDLSVAENGKISFRPVEKLLIDLLAEDAGVGSMPPLQDFISKGMQVPVVVSWDKTGFGKLKLTTMAINNHIRRSPLRIYASSAWGPSTTTRRVPSSSCRATVST